jgi:acyl-CoA synthetase (AMP-forming)/AMP-acid ligase II
MFTLLNHSRGPYRTACVGHHGLILRLLLHNTYMPLLIDHTTGDLARDPTTGFATRTPYATGGEMLVRVPSKRAFGGYWRNPAATDKKFATDVFKKGDLYYRSGDALRRDADGKWFFLDRLGDTFRWKSENVSTAEVAECLGHFPGVSEANVYGVLVPNAEGRAGCAALQIDEKVFPKTAAGEMDWGKLLAYARGRLPRYAVPVFLRVVGKSAHIHNHKQNKVPLRKEGVDPKLVGTEAQEGRGDVILWLKPGVEGYVPFEKSDWADLEESRARL